MLDLHVFFENVRDLVHVFAHRVAFHHKLAAARVSYHRAMICRNCLESSASWEKSLGSTFIPREVVGLNVQGRNQEIPIEKFLVQLNGCSSTCEAYPLVFASGVLGRAYFDAFLVALVDVIP